MRIFFLCALLATGICGCSTTAKTEAQPVEATEATEATNSPSFLFPFTLELAGTEIDDDIEITLTIQYQREISGRPRLLIEPMDDTEVEGIPLSSTVPSPKENANYVRKFRIRGTVPAIRATLLFEDDGLAMEMHESFPPEVQRYRDTGDPLTPLPAPIEVEGDVIDMGVNVQP